MQNPDQAEAPLQKALSIDPFYADARFSYGYAIWRRVDATQLDDMAAQWNLALEINPLHYLTHWHFGNGHTNLTYADYAHPADSTARSLLDKSEKLIVQDQIEEAIEVTRSVGEKYPESVLPAMTRGSIFYMSYDMERQTRLDSAEAIFRSILKSKQNYGPAHNGLAAVIKQRQFEQLDRYEELEREINQTPVPDEESEFYDVFPDAEYYSGDHVKRMIARQIGPSKAYLPMIEKLESDFAIPPLHIDLTEAMDNNFFRYGTTFDNRQWMDIRGVGSGATGIEYLERGAHLERNVLAHEYAHLYHGRILTDWENRRIRALYHQAMKNNQTLDYYAANNESEFFAQGYAGFLSEEKVHPLNHKSMNTRSYIKQKDPAFYAFLDSLLNKQHEYLAGNKEVFNDNWAQTYLTLANRSSDADQTAAYLDSSLAYSPEYVPSILGYAEFEAQMEDFKGADKRIARAERIKSQYAPIYVSKAEIEHRKALSGTKSFEEAINEQANLFEKADRLENDLSERSSINRIQRERYYQYGYLGKAMETARTYVEKGPEISTYLRDRKEEAETFFYRMRSLTGYSASASDFFEKLVDQNPQNFEYRLVYADILIRADRLDEAESVINEGQRILRSADNERKDYKLRLAWAYLLKGELEQADGLLEKILAEELNIEDQLLTAELYVRLHNLNRADTIINAVDTKLPIEQAKWQYVKGMIWEERGKMERVEEIYRSVLEINPYHLKARLALIALLDKQGRQEAKTQLVNDSKQLPVPLGPDFDHYL